MASITRPLVTLVLALSASLAHAQFRDMWGTGWNNPVSASIGSSIYWKTMMQTPKGSTGSKASPTPAASAPRTAQATTAQAAAASVTFPAGKPPIAPRQVADAMGNDPAHRAELADAFRQFLDLFEKDAIADKEPRNLARAAAFFIMANYIVATGKTPSESQADGLQKALQSNLLANAPFQAKTARQRQELYETLIIHGYLPLYGVKDGEEKNNPKQVAMFRDFARQGLKTVVGVTPEEMTFTSAGVVFK